MGGSAVAAGQPAGAIKPVVLVRRPGGLRGLLPGGGLRRDLHQPSTITGSIGTTAAKVDASGLVELLSARRLSIQNGVHADMDGPFRPLQRYVERALIGERLQKGYDRFCRHCRQRPPSEFLAVKPMRWRAAGSDRGAAVSRKLCDKSED